MEQVAQLCLILPHKLWLSLFLVKLQYCFVFWFRFLFLLFFFPDFTHDYRWLTWCSSQACDGVKDSCNLQREWGKRRERGINQKFSEVSMHQNSSEDLLKHRFLIFMPDLLINRCWVRKRICISNQLPGNLGATNPGTML